jgi:hypothetical protein
VYETNDYFALMESAGTWWRATHFLGEGGRVEGFLVSGAEGRASDRGRREEFEVWARAERPDEAEYRMPDGAIDATGDRAPRMRALLGEWRAAVGPAPPH